ncbi:MAG TPA: SRPBCC domain-containing protein [Caulobacteraceae bacterium]|nr:SRPBCC domain-containing protein [Caulobacteraceae bacterium]
MSEPLFPLATFTRKGAVTEGRFDLMLDNHIEEVWDALTKPDVRVQWLAPGTIESRLGGAAKLAFEDSGIVIDSAVTAFEPMRLLEFSWSGPGEPERPIRFELAPVGAEVEMTLTVSVPADEDAGRACAGWAAHLEMLAATLAGAPTKFPFPTFKAASDLYRVQVAAL